MRDCCDGFEKLLSPAIAKTPPTSFSIPCVNELFPALREIDPKATNGGFRGFRSCNCCTATRYYPVEQFGDLDAMARTGRHAQPAESAVFARHVAIGGGGF